VDKEDIIDGSAIKPSDKIIGIESSGLHSNGYSLVNYLLTRHQIFYADHPELLTPTTIYAPVVNRLLSEMDEVYGMAHITGGGIPENLPRCLPEGLKANVDWNSWTVPEIFKKIQLKGNVDELEMRRVFNLGIGYCVVVPANRLEFAMDVIKDENLRCWEIGEVYE
jgi:phosphoribosylformylglycinamidine cyclo-ligase